MKWNKQGQICANPHFNVSWVPNYSSARDFRKQKICVQSFADQWRGGLKKWKSCLIMIQGLMDLTPATSLVLLSSDIQHRGSLSDKSNWTCFIMPIPFAVIIRGKCLEDNVCRVWGTSVCPADRSSTITRLKQDLFFLGASHSWKWDYGSNSFYGKEVWAMPGWKAFCLQCVTVHGKAILLDTHAHCEHLMWWEEGFRVPDCCCSSASAAGMCSAPAKHYVIINSFYWAKPRHNPPPPSPFKSMGHP